MVCIHCGAKTHVTNSRLQRRSNQVWRRRQCLNCQAVFTTEEGAQLATAWTVQAANGALEPFSRDKLMLSLYQSCGHRPTALQDASHLSDTVVHRLSSAVENGRIWAGSIAQVCQVVLNRFDKAAASYYAARHSA